MENDNDNIPTSKKKTGNKPKQLVEGTYLGIEVGRGENKKIIDPKEVEKLAALGMKISEMSEWFGVDDSTLNYNFKQNILKGKHNLNCSLRQAQIRLALSGNATMLIWLGRNILGQSDSPFDSEGNAPLPWDDNI
jgi:hypothetical protein